MDVEKLADQAGFELDGLYEDGMQRICSESELRRFAALVLEEAARVCEKRASGLCDSYVRDCAQAIRALKPV